MGMLWSGSERDRGLQDTFQTMVLRVGAVCSAVKARNGGPWICNGSRGRDQAVEKKLPLGVDEFKEA